jgi:thiamine biosynthesis lipoprotein
MGTLFRVEVDGADSTTAIRLASAAFDSVTLVDSLLSTYRDDSEVSRWVGRDVGKWGRVSDVFIENLLLARRAFAATGGAFDVTLDGLMESVVIDKTSHSIMLANSNIRFDFGGSAKGDALDRALRAFPESLDVLVDLGGQTSVHGNGRVWQIAIVDPTDVNRSMAIIEMSSGSVATSATYELGDHIVDPRSGEVPDELISATVVHLTGGWADALSTGMFVMGGERAIALADSLGIAFLGITNGTGVLSPERVLMSDAMREFVSLREDLTP